MLLHQHRLCSRPKLIPERLHWHRSCCVSFWSQQRRQRLQLGGAPVDCRVVMGAGDHESAVPGLLGTCALMFVGAYGCGMLPAWVSISEQRSSNVNAVGAGLLLGSALCVILPEGFEAAMELHEESGLAKWSLSLTLLAGFWFMLVLDTLSHWLPGSSSNGASGGSRVAAKANRSSSGEEQVMLEHPTAAAAADCNDKYVDPDLEQHVVLLTDMSGRGSRAAGSTTGSSQPSTPRVQVAAREERSAAAEQPFAGRPSFSSSSSSLRPAPQPAGGTSGGTAASVMGPGPGAGSSTGLSRLGGPVRTSLPQGPGAGSGGGAGWDTSWWHWTAWLKDPSQQALLGLMVHAASDGLAVGAASLAEEPAVSLGVAVAMVVHKGPVAMGLGAFLRAAHWAPAAVHRGILLFSLASPVAALLTYVVLSALPVLSGGSNIPLAVLFSGGTVLYAATMHILPSALGSHQHHLHLHAHASSSYGESAARTASNSSSRMNKGQQQQDSSKLQLLLVSLGMVLPLLLMVLLHVEHEH